MWHTEPIDLSRRGFLAVAGSGAWIALGADAAAVGVPSQTPRPRRARVLVFDVNETLLDIHALEPHFARVFGEGRVLDNWFSTVLLYSEVVSLAGPYVDFSALGGAALEMTAASRGVTLTAADRDSIVGGMRSLPAHPDVRPAVERLAAAGFRMVTLTNSSPTAVQAQLANAGIAAFFERAFSVDEVRRFKPAPEPYRFVAKELGIEPSHMRMIAAHAWDVVGALQAGCSAAFVARPGKVLFPLGPKPDLIAPTLQSLAEMIERTDLQRE
jgi:2-haloacid dehalogenase